jgi:hypothetical protein
MARTKRSDLTSLRVTKRNEVQRSHELNGTKWSDFTTMGSTPEGVARERH